MVNECHFVSHIFMRLIFLQSLPDSNAQSNPSASTFYASSSTQSNNYNNRMHSGGDMPSLLMSVLRAENIDFETDIYWMHQFHHQKVTTICCISTIFHAVSSGHQPRQFGGLHPISTADDVPHAAPQSQRRWSTLLARISPSTTRPAR
jgi:hypothetical protein